MITYIINYESYIKSIVHLIYPRSVSDHSHRPPIQLGRRAAAHPNRFQISKWHTTLTNYANCFERRFDCDLVDLPARSRIHPFDADSAWRAESAARSAESAARSPPKLRFQICAAPKFQSRLQIAISNSRRVQIALKTHPHGTPGGSGTRIPSVFKNYSEIHCAIPVVCQSGRHLSNFKVAHIPEFHIN